MTTGGVSIGGSAVLKASYAAGDPSDPAYAAASLVQTGGTITLGTMGTPDANGAVNATYGYQNMSTSGAISVAAGAKFDVSGGPGGANINNSGGAVILRAPILTDNTVKVDFRGSVIGVVDGGGNPIGKGVVLNPYAVWSTTDRSTGAQHFDGIIDPAGWFDAAGNPLPGTDQHGNTTDQNGKTGRYVCLDRPAARKMVTTRFNLLGAYRAYFDKEGDDDPGVSGVALGLDTKKAKDGGRTSAFIREIRFFR